MQRIKTALSFIIIWLTLTSTAPFIFYLWPGHPYKILTFGGLLLMIVFFLFKTKKTIEFDRNLIIVLSIQFAYFIITAIIFQNFQSINLGIQLIALFIIILFINNLFGFEKFVKSYIYFILAMAIGGTIMFFLHLLIGVSPVFHVNYPPANVTYFLGLTSTNTYYHVEGIRLIRYAGFFDEPGTFAIYSLFAILLNKMYFDNRKLEYLLIITTAFTLSLAFLVLVFLYVMLFYFKLSYIKYVVLPVILLVFILYRLDHYTGKDNTIIYLKGMTVDRLKYKENGIISGNNRREASIHDRQIFFRHPVLGSQGREGLKGISFFFVLASHGLLGSVFYYSLLLYFLIRILKLHGEEQIFLLKIYFLIVINFFHRPDFSSVLTLLAIYCMIKYLDLTHKPVLTRLVARY